MPATAAPIAPLPPERVFKRLPAAMFEMARLVEVALEARKVVMVDEAPVKVWRVDEPLRRRFPMETTPEPSMVNRSLVPKAVEEEILNLPESERSTPAIQSSVTPAVVVAENLEAASALVPKMLKRVEVACWAVKFCKVEEPLAKRLVMEAKTLVR